MQKCAKFENENNMAAACCVALVLEELGDDSALLEASNSEDDEFLFFLLIDSNERKSHVRIDSYFERIIPLYSVSDFRSHFRMSTTTVSFLEGLLAACPGLPHQQRNGGRPIIDLQKQLLITIWILGNPECLRSVADRFNVTKSSAFRVYHRICGAISNNLSGQLIKFPSGQRAIDVAQGFEEKRAFPGVLGAIDGCHIPVKAPRQNHEQYVNRKGFHSLQLQVICDMDMQFTDVFCGYPGSVHDARVFRNSPFFQDAEANPDLLFPRNTHLLGDSAYPLKSWVLTPFRNNGRLTRRQKRYNFVHSSTRMVVERSRSLLKGRFRKLKTQMEVDKIEDAPVIIVAACVLHNVCLMNDEDDIQDFMDDDSDDDDDDNDDDAPPCADGELKRNEIMRNLP